MTLFFPVFHAMTGAPEHQQFLCSTTGIEVPLRGTSGIRGHRSSWPSKGSQCSLTAKFVTSLQPTCAHADTLTYHCQETDGLQEVDQSQVTESQVSVPANQGMPHPTDISIDAPMTAVAVLLLEADRAAETALKRAEEAQKRQEAREVRLRTV